MDILIQGIQNAIKLIFSLNPEILQITWLTLKVSGIATILALAFGIPCGILLAFYRFPFRKIILTLINTGMGLPPVVVGLFIAIILWRSGPFGFLNLMYTPTAMIIAQFIIAFPIIAGFSTASFQQVSPNVYLQAIALGASKWQAIYSIMKEVRLSTLAGIMAGFGGVISEVGAVLMVGGNIKGKTRVLTTAILLETRMGKFEMAIALSIILLIFSFSINYYLTHLQQRGEKRWFYPIWK